VWGGEEEVEEQLGEVQVMLGRRDALGEVHLDGGAGRRSAGRGEEKRRVDRSGQSGVYSSVSDILGLSEF
jgi:hypothetical protein